jgi:hypothetical protein
MLKKIRRALALTLAFVMMFSMTAFAAEKGTDRGTDIKLDNVEYSHDGATTRGPAPTVSSVKIEGAYIDNSGDVIVQVYVVGYGHNEVAKWDGRTATLEDEDLITGVGNVVYAFRQYWNCGPAVVGTHTFTYSTTSINFPHNTVSANAQFKVS